MQQWAKVIKEVQEEEAARDDTWVERNSKPCKGCGARIQKTGGCNHLVCSKCKHQFCWVSYHFYATEGGEVGHKKQEAVDQSKPCTYHFLMCRTRICFTFPTQH